MWLRMRTKGDGLLDRFFLGGLGVSATVLCWLSSKV